MQLIHTDTHTHTRATLTETDGANAYLIPLVCYQCHARWPRPLAIWHCVVVVVVDDALTIINVTISAALMR